MTELIWTLTDNNGHYYRLDSIAAVNPYFDDPEGVYVIWYWGPLAQPPCSLA